MANPQVEKGYTRIANELLQAMSMFRFTSTEWSLIATVARLTWGYQRKRSKISYGTLSRFTGIPKRTVIRSVDTLDKDKVFDIVRNGRKVNEMGINKDYVVWKRDRYVTSSSVVAVTRKGVSPVTTIKEINKEINIKKMDDFKNRFLKEHSIRRND